MRLWSTKRSSVSQWTDGLRFDPARSRRGHVESWFLKANDPRGRRAIWLKWTIWSGPGGREHAVAEAWAIAFGGADGHVATKTTVPFEQARFASRTIGASVDGCTLSADAAHGRVESGGRAIAYDLTIASLEAPLVHFQKAWMYEGGFPKQKIVSPIPNARISGSVVVRRVDHAARPPEGRPEGDTWTLDAWPGMVGHNWGAGNSESYAWGHCNAWDDEDDVVFEGFSARVRAGGVLLPTTTALCLRHHGTSYMLGRHRRLRRSLLPEPRRHRLLLPELEARPGRDHGSPRGARPADPALGARCAGARHAGSPPRRPDVRMRRPR